MAGRFFQLVAADSHLKRFATLVTAAQLQAEDFADDWIVTTFHEWDTTFFGSIPGEDVAPQIANIAQYIASGHYWNFQQRPASGNTETGTSTGDKLMNLGMEMAKRVMDAGGPIRIEGGLEEDRLLRRSFARNRSTMTIQLRI